LKKETISFSYILAAGQDIELEEELKWHGEVQEVRVKFNPGQQGTLHVNPRLVRHGKSTEELIQYPKKGEPHLSGDDDYKVYPISHRFKHEEKVLVYAKNVSTKYDRTINVDIVVQYDAEGSGR
jgi:hypothetical protein